MTNDPMKSDLDPLSKFLEPARVLAALKLPRTGRVFELGTVLGHGMPAGPADVFAAFRISPYRTPRSLRDPDYKEHDFSMEILTGSPHLGTHIDAFTHVQAEGRIFGGHAVADAYGDLGWHVNGIENTPPIMTRGILLDMPRELGIGEALPQTFEIQPKHLVAALDARKLDVREGDAVFVRTGKFAADYERDPAVYFGPQPGVGPDAAIWLHDRGMAILGTDTSGTEVFPAPNPTRTTHRAMLVERGVHLIEIMDLEEMAKSDIGEFLFLCLPLRIRGGTGSWIRPIAIA